jgi:hypothetical protein
MMNRRSISPLLRVLIVDKKDLKASEHKMK